MEQSPSWEANSFSASKKTPRILWNPQVHYRIHKSPSPMCILSQIDLVHALQTHFSNILFNIIPPFISHVYSSYFFTSILFLSADMARVPQVVPFFRFSEQNKEYIYCCPYIIVLHSQRRCNPNNILSFTYTR
jgi:hypothetical protein